MEKRDSIQFHTIDYVIIAATLFLLICTWCYVIIEYGNLPETIAVHFDGAGNPDGYNDKNSIWLAPILFSLLSIGLIIGAKYPEHINFPYKKLSEKDKKKGSKTALLSSLLLSTILVLIVHSMIKTSIGFNAENNPMYWVVPVIICLVVAYLAVLFYYQFKNRKND